MGKKFIDLKTLGSQMMGAGGGLIANKTINEIAEKVVGMATFIPAEFGGIVKGLLKVATGSIGPGFLGKKKNDLAVTTGGAVIIGDGVRDVINHFKPGFLAGTDEVSGNEDEDERVAGLGLLNESYDPGSGVGSANDAVG